MPKNRLIVLSTSELPAWEIDLEPGQQYTGCDEKPGHLALTFSLGARAGLTGAQERQLADHPDVLSFSVYPARRSVLSPTQGIGEGW